MRGGVLIVMACLSPLAVGCTGEPTAMLDGNSSGSQAAMSPHRGSVILVGLDGLRADYLDRYDAPTLQRLAASGAVAEGGMSRALLKLSGSLVHDYATISDDSPSPNRASRARRAATSAGIS